MTLRILVDVDCENRCRIGDAQIALKAVDDASQQEALPEPLRKQPKCSYISGIYSESLQAIARKEQEAEDLKI